MLKKYRKQLRVLGWLLLGFVGLEILSITIIPQVFKNEDIVSYSDIKHLQNQSSISNKPIRHERTYLFKWEINKVIETGALLNSKEYDVKGNLIRENNNQYSYDERGNLIREIKENFLGEYDTTLNKYNEVDQLIQKINISSSYNRKTNFHYDSLGNKMRQLFYINDSLDSEFIFQYDDSSRVLNQVYTNFTENRKTRELYQYQGNTKHTLTYKADGNLLHKIIFKYDSLGNEIEQTIINNKGETQSINIYKYNLSNQVIYYLNELPEGKTREQFWEYDTSGNLIRSIDYYGPGPLRELKYKYDPNNRLIEKTIFDLNSGDKLATELILYERFEENN